MLRRKSNKGLKLNSISIDDSYFYHRCYTIHIVNNITNRQMQFLSTCIDFFLGLGRYGHQPYRYVFDTDLVDTIRIRYDTHVHDIRFQNLELWISTTNKCFGLIYTVNSTNTSSKTQ